MKNTKSGDVSSRIELSFEEMLWRLLEQWKVIFLAGLIIAILFSAYQYYQSLHRSQVEIRANEELRSKSEDEILEELPEDEQGMVSSLINLHHTKEELMDYISKSAYMHLDSADLRAANIEFAVQAEESRLNTLTDSYVAFLRSGSLAQSISELEDISLRSADVINLTRVALDSKSSSGLISYTLYLPKGIASDKIIETIKSGIEERKTALDAKIGSHKVTIITEEEKSLLDFGITRDQADTYSYLNNMTNQETALLSNCSSRQKEIYETLLNREELIQDSDNHTNISFIDKKSILLGFILGAFLAVAISVLCMIINRRIQTPDILKKMGKIRILGEWYEGTSVNIFNWLLCSPLVYRIHYGKQMDYESELNSTSNVVLNTCQHRKLSEVMFVCNTNLSDLGNRFIQSVMRSLREADVESNLEIIIRKEKRKDSDSLYLNRQGVIIIAVNNETRLKDLDSTVDHCNYYDVPIVGCIYLG